MNNNSKIGSSTAVDEASATSNNDANDTIDTSSNPNQTYIGSESKQ